MKKNELRGQQLENELVLLTPINFETLQDYFSTFKSLVLQLKQCGLEKKDDQLILDILPKLGLDYSILFFTFHATKLMV